MSELLEFEVRLARAEERIERLMDDEREAREARANLNDSVELMRVTVGAMNVTLAHIQSSVESSILALRKDIDGINANIRWVVLLVLSLVLTAVVGIVLSGAAGKLHGA